MNAPLTETEAQAAIGNLNILFAAAASVQPSGLVPEAAKAQSEAVAEAAKALAGYIQKAYEPAVSPNFEPVVEEDPPVKAAKSK